MDRRPLYEEDVHAWSQDQAAVLRQLARTRRDLPNGLDLEHVAEEIEDVGRSERAAVESLIRQILVHIAKTASAPEAPSVKHWRKEMVAFHNDLVGRYTASMAQHVDLDALWRRALREADAALDADGDRLAEGLPPRAPVTLDDLTAEGFDPSEAVAALRAGDRG